MTPQHLALVGRELATRGNSLFKIEVKDGAVELVPASTLSVLGESDPSSWTYLTTTVGPSDSTTVRLPSTGVVHFRVGASSWEPWRGVAPLNRGAGTGALAAAVESSLTREAKLPTGRLGLSHGGDVKGTLNWMKQGGFALAGDAVNRGLQQEPSLATSARLVWPGASRDHGVAEVGHGPRYPRRVRRESRAVL